MMHFASHGNHTPLRACLQRVAVIHYEGRRPELALCWKDLVSTGSPNDRITLILHEDLIEDAIKAVDQDATHPLVERGVGAALESY